ncbi:MAG: hypothetical protein MJK04_04605 [Psychrosphaera sp.]|nr:hypothetical protein [Psychrosphaera sp.]
MVTIAGALSDTPLLGECKINTTIRKDWFLTWSAMGFDLEVVKNDLSLVTSASVYKDFDRKILPSHHKRYHFTWSQFRDGHSVASYLDVELDLNNNLERLTLANCGLFPEKTYHIGYLEACAVEKQVIECS